MNNARKPAATLATLLSLLSLSSAVAADEKAPFRIGAILSTTGPIAGVGIPERDGALLAQKFINSKGGVNGRPIELLIEDDASNPDTAVTRANALVRSSQVQALIGSTGLASTVAIGGLTDPIKLPHVALSGIGPAIEFKRTCLVHLLAPQELNARAALVYAKESIHAKKIAVLHDSGYGQAVFNSIKQVISDYGLELAQAEKFDIGATDVTAQAAKIKSVAPQAVIVIASSATPFRNLRDVQIAVPIIGSIASSSYEYIKAMGEASNGVIFPEFLISEDPLPHQKTFVEQFKAEYGRLPKNYEAAGWDAVQLIAKTLATTADGNDNQKFCAALRGPFKGTLAEYDFSAENLTGMQLSSFSYSQVKDGAFVRLPFRVSQ